MDVTREATVLSFAEVLTFLCVVAEERIQRELDNPQ